MAYRNYIHIEESLLDKPIYRIMSISRVLQALESKKLVLVKPKKWDDPFENALLASAFEMTGGDKTSFAAKESVYGQCWTIHRETDAMWRIYSADKDGVRIATTPRKLFDALRAADPDFWQVRCFVGKVTYLKKDELLTSLGQIDLMSPDGSGIAESLLYKRREFSHEREIRLIYSGPDNACTDDLFPFDIEPEEVFDRLTFDPRMDKELVNAYTLAIRSKGFKRPINQSGLYRAPKGLVFKLQIP